MNVQGLPLVFARLKVRPLASQSVCIRKVLSQGKSIKVFVCPRTNSELVSKFHIVLSAPQRALTKLSKFRHKATTPIQNSSSTQMLNSFLCCILQQPTSSHRLTFSLPNVLSYLQLTLTRRTSGYSLGTFHFPL
jgi:hypothetical protein